MHGGEHSSTSMVESNPTQGQSAGRLRVQTTSSISFPSPGRGGDSDPEAPSALHHICTASARKKRVASGFDSKDPGLFVSFFSFISFNLPPLPVCVSLSVKSKAGVMAQRLSVKYGGVSVMSSGNILSCKT